MQSPTIQRASQQVIVVLVLLVMQLKKDMSL
jgi:hypothetical protein